MQETQLVTRLDENVIFSPHNGSHCSTLNDRKHCKPDSLILLILAASEENKSNSRCTCSITNWFDNLGFMKARASRIMLAQKSVLQAFVAITLASIQQCRASFDIARGERILKKDDSHWRYVLIFDGMSADEGACVAPDPVASISSGDAEIELVDYRESRCTFEDRSLVCQGSGTIIFDAYDAIEGTLLRVDMKPLVGPTSCTGTVSQAFTLGLVCPDGRVSYEMLGTCVPASAYFLKENTTVPLCVATCGDSCTERVLGEISTEIFHYGCQWPSGKNLDRPIKEPEIEIDPEDTTEPMKSPSPSPTEKDDNPVAPVPPPNQSTPDIFRDTTPAQPPSAVFHTATDSPSKAKAEDVSVFSTSGAQTAGSGLLSAAVLGFVASFFVSLL